VRAPAFGDVNGVSTAMPVPVDTLIMIKDPAPNCVHNQDTLLTTMVMVVCFSVCVQMAEGLHFGIVPYISRPALGVVSGMVGAGGNAGALFAGKAVIGPSGTLDGGFVNLGFVIMGASLIMHLIYFPDEGGILLPKGLPFNPQLVKAKEGQKGADQLDFSNVKSSESKVSV
jgi:NNP family nitrate/nitrite transporter-like MFS transporter